MKQVHIEATDEGHLLIIQPETGELVAKHQVESSKGKLIQDTSHRRDRTKGINAYLETVVSRFSDKDRAAIYLEAIRKRRSRYIRDQLQMILKQIEINNQRVIDTALEECMAKQLFSATEFIDMVQYLNRQRDVTVTKDLKGNEDISSIHPYSDSVLQTEIHKRDVQEYVSVLEGDV